MACSPFSLQGINNPMGNVRYDSFSVWLWQQQNLPAAAGSEAGGRTEITRRFSREGAELGVLCTARALLLPPGQPQGTEAQDFLGNGLWGGAVPCQDMWALGKCLTSGGTAAAPVWAHLRQQLEQLDGTLEQGLCTISASGTDPAPPVSWEGARILQVQSTVSVKRPWEEAAFSRIFGMLPSSRSTDKKFLQLFEWL